MSLALSASCAPGTTRKRLSFTALLMTWRNEVGIMSAPAYVCVRLRGSRMKSQFVDRRQCPDSASHLLTHRWRSYIVTGAIWKARKRRVAGLHECLDSHDP